MTLMIDSLVNSIRSSSVYNPDIQVAPACILWPDRERQFEAIIPVLQTALPELLVLGDYAPEKRTGPAIWLRCVIAGIIKECVLPKEYTPIIYMPGVSRHDLRVSENYPPEHLSPLVELQFRGAYWSQINAKDWTILAFLKSGLGGLGLDVAQDNDTKNAMQLALFRLIDEDVELLKGKRLDRDYFNTLLTGGDIVRDLLQWLDNSDKFRSARNELEWNAFVDVCKSQLAFDPQKDGVLAGAAKLAGNQGPWHAVWERFCEAPKRYSNIPSQIRKCKTPVFDSGSDEKNAGGWPQWNEDQEKNLRNELVSLIKLPSHEARNRIIELEKKHHGRRSLVWAELGEAPLACALKHLAIIAEYTKNSLASGSIDDLVTGYSSFGWKIDNSVICALAGIENQPDFEAVSTAIRSLYMPWIEDSARYLQNCIDKTNYPGGNYKTLKPFISSDGDCFLFIDGLRFDIAKRLAELLTNAGYSVSEEITWSALPSLTSTGKAAVTPVRDKIQGKEENTDFEPVVAETGQSLKGGYHLKKLLTDAKWTVLERSSDGDGQGRAWCEFGDIDHEGHDRGWKLSKHLDTLLLEIKNRITALFAAGWKRIRVVTDHGWLLMPGGLPKIDLSASLVENKWGRCASLKSGASTRERLYPWFWNPEYYFALADGISCFKMGEEYAHGGLSLQECVTLQLTVNNNVKGSDVISVEITDIVWKGLRCTIVTDGNFTGLACDIRLQAGDPSTSAVVNIKPLKDNGTVSVVIENEDLEGRTAVVVLLDTNGSPAAQAETVIGGGNR
jgi:hypothetical protein